MKSKLAAKHADIISLYLDERGRYDIRKSEERRFKLRKVDNGLCKFDIVRNRDIHEGNAITNLINNILKHFYEDESFENREAEGR